MGEVWRRGGKRLEIGVGVVGGAVFSGASGVGGGKAGEWWG